MTWLDSMVWSELDLQALLLKNRVRTPGDGLLRPTKLKQFRPAERNKYVSEMAKRYHTTVPREKKLRDLEHLVDPTGVITVAAAQTGTHVVGNQPRPRPVAGSHRKQQHGPGMRSAHGFPALSTSASVSTVASKSVEAVSPPRLPKGKATTFRASVRAEILGAHKAADR